MKDPRKSDVDAKTAYVKELELKGYKNIKKALGNTVTVGVSEGNTH